MAVLQIPPAFQASYENLDSYPKELVYQPSYSGATEGYLSRLNNAAPRLFTNDPKNVLVPFRDLQPTGQGFVKYKMLNDADLKEWLGDLSQRVPNDPHGSVTGPMATKKDPMCRFIFLHSGNSRKPLNLTRTMLVRILTYHQVMPIYLDFIAVFGAQTHLRDLRFSGFREQCLISSPTYGPAVPELGRSGRQIQLCYNLKAANCKNYEAKLNDKEWSIRQAAFHHQFDVVFGTTLWIVTKGDLSLKDRIESMNGPRGKPEDKDFSTPELCFKNTLSVHLLYCYWATEEWRWYIQYLEEVVEDLTGPALYGSRRRSKERYQFTPEHVLKVQDYEDKTNQAVMILEANVNVMVSLRKCYERLVANNDFPIWKSTCAGAITTFTDHLNDMISDSEMQISRAKLLVQVIGDRKSLVREHLQSQATEKMENLTISNYREAIAMRIITVVTLIYLPATFVSYGRNQIPKPKR